MTRGGIATAAAVALVLWGPAAFAGSSVDEPRQPDGSTPLQWAVFKGNLAEATRLLKAGADVKATNNYGVNAMQLAADNDNLELIRLLLKSGADANSPNPDGETALHLVARSGDVEAAKLLLKAGATVDARERFGEQTPLMWAVARRHPDMVELLASSGADVNARSAVRDYQRVATAESRAKQLDRGGFTPLMYAARENCEECVDVLLKHHADVNMPDPSGVVPVSIAMMNSNWDIAKQLVDAGADVNQWDIFGSSPLHVAISSMNGANNRNPLDSDTPNKTTGHELVEMLIAGGANPNQQTYFRPADRGGGGRGTTPFMMAISSGDIDLVKELLAKGADPKLATSEGQGPIILAVQARGGGGGFGGFGGGRGGGGRGGPPPAAPGGAKPVAEPAGPASRTPVGRSVTGRLAAAPSAEPGAGGPGRAGSAAAVPPSRPGPGGAGARGRGFGGGGNSQVEMIKLLADAGADVHLVAHIHFLQRSRGGSAMHFAVRSGGNHQVIEALLDLGVDINAKDEDGLTALDYAMGRGYVPFLQMAQPPNKPLADFLRSHGANVELAKTPDWPPQGPPIATAVYDAVIWPVDPVGT